MLRENLHTRQHPGEGFRRWFSDDFFDVIIWYEPDQSAIFGFQLCYDVGGNEHSLTWRKDTGFRHETVDTGDSVQDIKMSPILVPDGPFPYKKVLDEFLTRFSKPDQEVLFFVYDKVLEYTNSGGKLI